MALGVVIAGSAIFSYEASRPTSGDSNHEELIVGLGAPTDPVLLDHDLETQDTENGMTANAPNSTPKSASRPSNWTG